MTPSFLNTIFIVFFVIFFSCSREEETNSNIETISTFTISDYEFEVNKVVRRDDQTGKIIETSYDTVLVNLCDVCGCEEDDDYEEDYH